MNYNKSLSVDDRNFIEPFLKNKTNTDGNKTTIVVPTETIMFPTELLNEKLSLLEKIKSHCFRIDPGAFGWCATCKVSKRDLLNAIQSLNIY